MPDLSEPGRSAARDWPLRCWVIPVRVQRGLQAGGGQHGHPACSAITAVPAVCPTPQHRDHAQGLRRASPQVKRVLHPAPHRGLESSAARSARTPSPSVAAVSSTVRSISRRSRSRSISQARNETKVPSVNGGSSAPKQPSTSCQRRSQNVT